MSAGTKKEGLFKRKNDQEEEEEDSNSNSKDDYELKSNESITNAKKLKIPIKLAIGSNKDKSPTSLDVLSGADNKKTSSFSTSKTTINKTNQNESSNNKSAPPIVPKLPSGNLAPSKKQPATVVKNVSQNVAKVFGSDESEEDTEEMPLEAKMRMRNVGRDTPTSTGPNSYGKTGSLGFVDHRKLFEKQLKEQAEQLLKEQGDQ